MEHRVEAREASIAKALQQNQFARSFKKQITPSITDAEMIQMIRSGLYKRTLNALGIVRRVGKLSSGFEKVKAGLKGSKFLAYIHAKDGAQDSVDRLKKLAAADENRTVMSFGEFTGIDLDQALGMDNVVHLGLMPSGPGIVFIREVKRLSGFLETGSA